MRPDNNENNNNDIYNNNDGDTNQNKYTYNITNNQNYNNCYIDDNDRRPIDSLWGSNVSKWRHVLRGEGYVQVSLHSGLARN